MKSPRSEICNCGTPIPRAHIQGLLMAIDEIAKHTGTLPDVVLADCRNCGLHYGFWRSDDGTYFELLHAPAPGVLAHVHENSLN